MTSEPTTAGGSTVTSSGSGYTAGALPLGSKVQLMVRLRGRALREGITWQNRRVRNPGAGTGSTDLVGFRQRKYTHMMDTGWGLCIAFIARSCRCQKMLGNRFHPSCAGQLILNGVVAVGHNDDTDTESAARQRAGILFEILELSCTASC